MNSILNSYDEFLPIYIGFNELNLYNYFYNLKIQIIILNEDEAINEEVLNYIIVRYKEVINY